MYGREMKGEFAVFSLHLFHKSFMQPTPTPTWTPTTSAHPPPPLNDCNNTIEYIIGSNSEETQGSCIHLIDREKTQKDPWE